MNSSDSSGSTSTFYDPLSPVALGFLTEIHLVPHTNRKESTGAAAGKKKTSVTALVYALIMVDSFCPPAIERGWVAPTANTWLTTFVEDSGRGC